MRDNVADRYTLQIEGLAVAYKVPGGEVEAVRDVSLSIRRGETLGLVGESGCGKSTVAWAIVNFLGNNGYVKRGSIRFQGQELTGGQGAGERGRAWRHLRGNRLAMIYQDPMQSLNPALRLGDQLKEVLVVHQGLDDAAAEARCLEMLARVAMPDPADVMRRYPHQISGGQQQRVVIAMALLNDPALLIMDEPTTALDVTVEAAVLDLVAELRRDLDTAILYITHNLGVVARICDRVGVMYAGELVEQADVGEIFYHPRHPYTQGLLRCLPRLGRDKGGGQLDPIRGRVPAPGQLPAGCVFGPRCDYVAQHCRDERPRLRALAGDACVRCHFAEQIDPAQRQPSVVQGAVPAAGWELSGPELLLTVDRLRTYYPVRGHSLRDVLGLRPAQAVRAVDGVSLALARGRTLGVVGESGCGKSTLARTLIGLESSTGGRVKFLGFDISGGLSTRSQALIRELQMVFQNPDATLNPAYTVGRQIARPMQRFKTVPARQVREEVVHLLEAVRLDAAYYDRYPHQLSGGEKQRVGIARALASQPELVLCDEPVSALDVSVQAAVLNLLLDLQRRYGTALLFIAHDLSVVRYLSDDVAVMYLGQVVEVGPSAAIYAPPFHPYTEALLSAVPIPDPAVAQPAIRLAGPVPSALHPPAGCRFHTRCPRRALLPDGGQICAVEAPPWRSAGGAHRILCHASWELLGEWGTRSPLS
jgi:peptide/nickel transport system ATP-binding protein